MPDYPFFHQNSDLQKDISAIKIVVADDHLLFISGIAGVIHDHPAFVLCNSFLNGKALLDWYDGKNADVILMDIRMPVPDGKETTKQLISRFPHVKIIALSNYSEPAEIRYMFNLGVYGYLLKDIEPADLIKTILKVNAGERFLPENIFLNSGDNNPADKNIPVNQLSSREMEVLKLIVKGKNNLQIATELNITQLTVKKHKENMMRKLGASSMLQLILNAGFQGIL